MSSDNATTELPAFPNYDWCIDIELYYQSSNDMYAAVLLKKIHEYKLFSYWVNGVLTTLLATLGLLGTFMLLMQIYSSVLFSKRLAVHLGMICIWDSLYLISCLATYGISSLLYSMTPSYGFISYILIVLQPFASFCVSCTIWQVLAITIERYWAVSKPLEQRTRKARFAVFWICLAIIIGAFVLNMLPVPFERHLVPCFEVGKYSIINHTMVKPYDTSNSRLYRLVVRFVPDLLFRAPVPIIFIAYLTGKTIQICNQRSNGTLQINTEKKRNIPCRLYLLNLKFILCNSLYMFNTILLELIGYGENTGTDSPSSRESFINSYYLTDVSNMLLVVHSATNWLLFYQWPEWKTNRRKLGSASITSSIRLQSLNPNISSFVLKRVSPYKTKLGKEIVTSLITDYREISFLVFGSEKVYPMLEKEDLHSHPEVHRLGEKIGSFMEKILQWVNDPSMGDELRKLGRRLGEVHFHSNVHLTADEWKDIRSRVVTIMVKHCSRDVSLFRCPYSTVEVHDTLTRTFNHLLSEMRSGTLCAAVEASKKSRSHSTCVFTSSKELSRIARSQSYARIHLDVNQETIPFIPSSYVNL